MEQFKLKSQKITFVEIDKLILKFRGPRLAKTTLKKFNKVGRLRLSDFKTYHKATVIKTF